MHIGLFLISPRPVTSTRFYRRMFVIVVASLLSIVCSLKYEIYSISQYEDADPHSCTTLKSIRYGAEGATLRRSPEDPNGIWHSSRCELRNNNTFLTKKQCDDACCFTVIPKSEYSIPAGQCKTRQIIECGLKTEYVTGDIYESDTCSGQPLFQNMYLVVTGKDKCVPGSPSRKTWCEAGVVKHENYAADDPDCAKEHVASYTFKNNTCGKVFPQIDPLLENEYEDSRGFVSFYFMPTYMGGCSVTETDLQDPTLTQCEGVPEENSDSYTITSEMVYGIIALVCIGGLVVCLRLGIARRIEGEVEDLFDSETEGSELMSKSSKSRG